MEIKHNLITVTKDTSSNALPWEEAQETLSTINHPYSEVIDVYPRCGSQTFGSNFCTGCGASLRPQQLHAGSAQSLPAENPFQSGPIRGLGKLIGIHPLPEITFLGANAMLFTGTVMTMGALVPVAILVGFGIGYITYKMQRSLYGDTHDVALAKGLALALLTSIPVGLPMFVTLPSGVAGLVHTLRKKD